MTKDAGLFLLALFGAASAGGCEHVIGADFSERRLAEGGATAQVGGGAGEGGASPTSVTTATTGGGGSGGHPSQGGAQPLDCWGPNATPWTIGPNVHYENLDGGQPRSFRMSADGLTLYYMAIPQGGPSLHRPHQVSRASRSDPFMGGTAMATWASSPTDYDHLQVVGDEMYLNDLAGDWDLMLSVFSRGQWSVPTPLGGGFNTADNDAAPTLSLDGTVLLFTRQDGVDEGYGPAYRLFEARRDSLAESFASPGLAAFPGVTDQDWLFCPVMADPLHLIVGTTYPRDLADPATDPNTAIRLYQSERPSVEAPWGALEPMSTFDSPQYETCPHLVSTDGCELWYEHWQLSAGTQQRLIATREPMP